MSREKHRDRMDFPVPSFFRAHFLFPSRHIVATKECLVPSCRFFGEGVLRSTKITKLLSQRCQEIANIPLCDLPIGIIPGRLSSVDHGDSNLGVKIQVRDSIAGRTADVTFY